MSASSWRRRASDASADDCTLSREATLDDKTDSTKSDVSEEDEEGALLLPLPFMPRCCAMVRLITSLKGGRRGREQCRLPLSLQLPGGIHPRSESLALPSPSPLPPVPPSPDPSTLTWLAMEPLMRATCASSCAPPSGRPQLLHGASVVRAAFEHLRSRVVKGVGRGVEPPALAAVLVGNRPDAELYMRRKREACETTGVNFQLVRMSETSSTSDIAQAIRNLRRQTHISGVFCQLPLPPQVDSRMVTTSVGVAKDVDGMHPLHMGLLAQAFANDGMLHPRMFAMHTWDHSPPVAVVSTAAPVSHYDDDDDDDDDDGRVSVPSAMLPCAPRAAVGLLMAHGHSVVGRACCVLGDGSTAGLPLALLLRALGASSVSLVSRAALAPIVHPDSVPEEDAHAAREHVSRLTRGAEIIFTAVGAPGYLTADLISPGAVVVDVGITVEGSLSSGNDYQVLGDVHASVFAAESPALAVSPVPGGVGPLTVAFLVENVIAAWERQHQHIFSNSKNKNRNTHTVK